MLKRPVILMLLLCITWPGIASAVSLGQVDNFEDGAAGNWAVGLLGAPNPAPPANVPSGGPAGTGDHYLLLSAIGGSGPGGKLSVINLTQWAGNYPASGVGAITMYLNNVGSTDLYLRVLLAHSAGGPPTDIAVSTVPVFLPAGSGWTFGVFPVGPADLIALKGSVNAALADATELRIFHNPIAAFPPPSVVAQLGVDNITAAAQPLSPPTSLFVERTTYSCDHLNQANPGVVDVFALSAAAASVTVSLGPALTATPQPLSTDNAGNFFADIAVADAGSLPSTVTVTATNAGNSQATVSSPLSDVVTITAADYDMLTQTLTITAASSDRCSAFLPTLTAEGVGALSGGTLTVHAAVAPPIVKVVSSRGGVDVAEVRIIPTPPPTFTISGTVATGGSGQGGVSLALRQGVVTMATTTTAASGAYIFRNVAADTYTVTPSLAGFIYAPQSTPVAVGPSAVNVNFTGTRAFTLSGTVKNSVTGAAVAGVTVNLSGAGTGTTMTDALGNYSFQTPNGLYSVTPAKAGFKFSPVSLSVTISSANKIGQNFRATPVFNISGTITHAGGAPFGGVTVALGGTAIKTTTTDAFGHYSFTDLINGSYSILPRRTGSLFTPAFRSVRINNADVTGQNFTGTP